MSSDCVMRQRTEGVTFKIMICLQRIAFVRVIALKMALKNPN